MSDSTAPPPVRDPLRSPTYPQRVHICERAHWQSILTQWDQKIAEIQKKGLSGPDSAKKYAQLAGARDQIATAVTRLPMEVGDMYHEDKHRLEEAVASLERLIAGA